MNLDTFRTDHVATDRGDDVFGLEFQNDWEARQQRRAARLSVEGQDRLSGPRRALARRLAAVGRSSAASVRRLDDVLAVGVGSRRSAAK